MLQEFARSPHSRSVSEKFTAAGEVMSPCIVFTQPAKSCGKSDCGIGKPSHDERRAHICSTSSTIGGVTVVVSAGAELAAGGALALTCGAPEACGARASTTAAIGKTHKNVRISRKLVKRGPNKRRTMLQSDAPLATLILRVIVAPEPTSLLERAAAEW